MLPWLVAYTLVLLAWALVITRRSTPTLWKGSSLVIVNTLFVVATIIYGFRRTPAALVLPGSSKVFVPSTG